MDHRYSARRDFPNDFDGMWKVVIMEDWLRVALFLCTMLTIGFMASSTLIAQERPEGVEDKSVLYVYDLTWGYSIDLNDKASRNNFYDEAHIVATLQGLLNRDFPRLYIRYVTEQGLNIDDFWLAQLTKPGEWLAERSIQEVGSVEDLLRLFRNAYKGVVVWDPNVPATSNVASTVAGADDLIPLRYDLNTTSLYYRLVVDPAGPRLPVLVWLINPDGTSLFRGEGTIPGTDLPSTGSAKNDAYIWAKVHYLDSGRSNPVELGYYLDAYWLQSPHGGVQQHLLVNHDFLISRKGFIFDLSPWDDETPIDDPDQQLGTDRHTLEAILRSAYQRSEGRMIRICGFVPWAYKYTNYGPAGGKHEPVPSEWKMVEVGSVYNAYFEADAHSLDAMANASVFHQRPGTSIDIKDLRCLPNLLARRSWCEQWHPSCWRL